MRERQKWALPRRKTICCSLANDPTQASCTAPLCGAWRPPGDLLAHARHRGTATDDTGSRFHKGRGSRYCPQGLRGHSQRHHPNIGMGDVGPRQRVRRGKDEARHAQSQRVRAVPVSQSAARLAELCDVLRRAGFRAYAERHPATTHDDVLVRLAVQTSTALLRLAVVRQLDRAGGRRWQSQLHVQQASPRCTGATVHSPEAVRWWASFPTFSPRIAC